MVKSTAVIARRARARTGFWSIALALVLFAAGQLAAPAHFALVQHRLCPEHGELEHVEPGRANCANDALACDAPNTDVAAHAPRGPVADAADAGGEGHDHCVLGDEIVPRATVAPVHPALHPSAFVVRAAARLDEPRPAKIASFLLAPKHSPPAAS